MRNLPKSEYKRSGESSKIKWLFARRIIGVALIIGALYHLVAISGVPLWASILASPTFIFFFTICFLLIPLWLSSGVQAMREGFIVLPIPLAVTIAIITLIGGLVNPVENTIESLKTFATALAPFMGAAFFMIFGSSFTKESRGVKASKSNRKSYKLRHAVPLLVSIELWLIGVGWWNGIGWQQLLDANPAMAFGLTFLGIHLLTPTPTNYFSFVADCALKSGFIISAATLSAYLYFLATISDMKGIGSILALGWMCLMYAGLAMTGAIFLKTLYGESSFEDDLKRNWHLLELFGFYVFLSMAPPTLFDLMGF